MDIKKLITLALAFMLPVQLWAESLELKFEDLKNRIETHNSRYSAAQLNQQAQQKRTGSFARSFLPSINLYGATETYKKGREESKTQPTYGAEAEVNLFNGGRDRLEAKARSARAEQAEAEQKIILAEELAQARVHYWNALYLREAIELMQNAVITNEKNLALADKRIKSGMSTQSDRYEFQMKLIQLRREINELKLKYQFELSGLALLVGASPNTEIKLTDSLEHEHDFEKSIEHTEKDHDFLVQQDLAAAEVKTFEAQKNSKWWTPRLQAFASYNQFNQREEDFPEAEDRTESVLGLKLRIDLSNGLEDRYEASALKYEARALKRAAEFKRKEVDFHLHREIAELKFLHELLHEAEENVSLSDKYDVLTQDEYKRGVKNSLDLLSSTEKKIESKRKYLEIVRDFQIAKSHVLSKLGR